MAITNAFGFPAGAPTYSSIGSISTSSLSIGAETVVPRARHIKIADLEGEGDLIFENKRTKVNITEELECLRAENDELRSQVEELRGVVEILQMSKVEGNGQ